MNKSSSGNSEVHNSENNSEVHNSEVLGLGVDLVEVERMRALLKRRPAIRERIFSSQERDFAALQPDSSQRLAVRFAAKEAVMKALGVGIGEVGLKDIEVVRLGSGAPSLKLSGRAQKMARQKGIEKWHISLSHTKSSAIAIAIAE